MLTTAAENALSRTITYGAAFTTVFVLGGTVTDPVNVTKFLSLGVVAGAALGVMVASNLVKTIRESIWIWVASGIFVMLSLVSVFFSDSPFSQGIYGSYGRNNGFLTYSFLTLLFLASTAFSKSLSIERLLKGLLFAGGLNVVYCLWVILFGDFVGWNNPYGSILGTLGNPNFIGAFLGIFLSAYLAFGLGQKTPRKFKYSLFFVIPLTAFEIYESHAIQGRVVGICGIGLVGFFFIRSKFGLFSKWFYIATCTVLGLLAILGALQIGPLTALIYKTSVSLRGQYWLAGWNAGNSHPLTGVGMDAFGDWYRRARDIRALELPGTNTVVNAAHNVPIDLLAFGGWPLLTMYLLIVALAGIALIKSAKRKKDYDPILVTLFTVWIGYQLQSLISINQIGLAIWGWVISGAAISYERITRTSEVESTSNPRLVKKVSKKDELDPRSVLFAISLASVGLIFALPPFASDLKWRSAQVSQTVQAIESSMKDEYFNPQNSTKYITNIQILEQSNFAGLAHKYAKEAVAWNPENFELWKVYYLIQGSSPEEKAFALENMKRLDPLNPDVAAR